MGKSLKRRWAGQLNVQKSARYQLSQTNDEVNSEHLAAGDDDNYEPPTKTARHDNSLSLCLMVIAHLQSILSDFNVCIKCKKGTLQVTPLSYNGHNTNLNFACDYCSFQRQQWTAQENVTDAVYMASNYAGIKSGQLEKWSQCMNMGYTNQKGQYIAVTCKSKKAEQVKEKLNIKLDEMKKTDENHFLQLLLDGQGTDDIKLAVDGMYPIRNNSGICLSTVMAKINGKCRIIGELKNTLIYKTTLHKKRFF